MINKDNGDMPAFPTDKKYKGRYDEELTAQLPGISKREYFAGLAMQGILANTFMKYREDRIFEIFSKDAVEFADALLTQLSNTNTESK